jgi:hypothetical protein
VICYDKGMCFVTINQTFVTILPPPTIIHKGKQMEAYQYPIQLMQENKQGAPPMQEQNAQTINSVALCPIPHTTTTTNCKRQERQPFSFYEVLGYGFCVPVKQAAPKNTRIPFKRCRCMWVEFSNVMWWL